MLLPTCFPDFLNLLLVLIHQEDWLWKVLQKFFIFLAFKAALEASDPSPVVAGAY